MATTNEFISYPIVEDDVVVVAGDTHETFRRRAEMQDLLAYRWVLPLASYEAEVRQWLERAFDASGGHPKPTVQIETNSISLLPRLIAQTGSRSASYRGEIWGQDALPLR